MHRVSFADTDPAHVIFLSPRSHISVTSMSPSLNTLAPLFHRRPAMNLRFAASVAVALGPVSCAAAEPTKPGASSVHRGALHCNLVIDDICHTLNTFSSIGTLVVRLASATNPGAGLWQSQPALNCPGHMSRRFAITRPQPSSTQHRLPTLNFSQVNQLGVVHEQEIRNKKLHHCHLGRFRDGNRLTAGDRKCLGSRGA